jgi:hypothetical protein
MTKKPLKTLMVGCLVFSWLALKDGTLLARDFNALRDRFLEEAPRQWERYKARAVRLQGSIVENTRFCYFSPPTEVLTERRYEIKQREGCALFLEQKLEGSSNNSRLGNLWVTNPRYGFQLFRRTPERPWAVAYVGKAINVKGIGTPQDMVNYYTNAPYTLSLIAEGVGAIGQDPGFSIKTVTPLAREGREFVKVEFTYQPKKPAWIPVRSGWVLYDPDHYWVIREVEVHCSYPGKDPKPNDSPLAEGDLNATFEYNQTGDGFPLFRRYSQKYQVHQFQPQRKTFLRPQTVDFDFHEGEVPEKEFTLSGYGFTEPAEAPRPPTPWYLWAGGGAVVCLVLAALFRRMSRRNSPSRTVGSVPTGAGK